jgi:ketosteroid isomerase-like protein
MEASAEIKELMTRFYDAASQGNFDYLDTLLSRRTGVLWIGTDPNEWWDDAEEAFKAWREQTRELGGPAPITAGDGSAYQYGDVAWVSDRPEFHLPDGRTLPFRFTAVWVKEPEGWRIVQVHSSFGVPNDAVLHTKVFLEK